MKNNFFKYSTSYNKSVIMPKLNAIILKKYNF